MAELEQGQGGEHHRLPWPATARAPASRARQTAAMSSPTQRACCHSPRAKIDSVGDRGGRRMASRSTGSSPRAIAGSPSVTRLIHRIWTGSSGTAGRAAGQEHDPDLARVGGQQVADEAADVVVDAPPLLDGGDDRGEVVVGQDHVGRFLAHVGAGDAHGHADVGPAQRRGVVDAVAGHGHHRSPSFQAPTMRSFCSGLVRANTRRGGDPLGQAVVVQRSSSAPVGPAGVAVQDADPAGDGGGGAGVVAGDHHRA